MTVSFACGHSATVGANANHRPVCGCGEARIARVTAPHPKIVGCATGPHVVTKMLDAAVVSVAKDGPLRLTAQGET